MAQIVAGSEVSDKNVIDWLVFDWSAGESNAVESQRFLDDHRGPRGIHKGKECCTQSIHITSVSDPAFLAEYRSGSRVLVTKEWEKICSWIKKLIFFYIKNCNLPIPRSPYRTSKLQKKPWALKREHPALQNMKLLNFFFFLWVIFVLLDPDPDSESGSGSTVLKESGTNPDLKHCQWKSIMNSNAIRSV